MKRVRLCAVVGVWMVMGFGCGDRAEDGVGEVPEREDPVRDVLDVGWSQPGDDLSSGGQDAASDLEQGEDAGHVDQSAPVDDAGFLDLSELADMPDMVVAPDMPLPPPAPVDCSGASALSGVELCASTDDTCEVRFTNRQGCAAVCEALNLVCAQSHEDLATCGPDLNRPPLECANTNHQSDHCTCARPAPGQCVPRTCAGRCGQIDDGCGSTLQCPMSCASGSCQMGGVCAAAVTCTSQSCPSFPGAEGYGATSRGGRGGSVYKVTSLANSGAGTLRDAVSQGSRTIVFNVAGTIDLTSPLVITASRLTIAGQTAPGDGITIRGFDVQVRADDVIIQHLRFRPGDHRKKTSTRPDGFVGDALTLQGRRIMVDHVSASWGIDEVLSAGARDWDRITVQYSIISEGLHKTGIENGQLVSNHNGHSKGGLFKLRDGDAHLTMHHNLFVSNDNRNPSIGNYTSSDAFSADLRNNLVYNHLSTGYTSSSSRLTRVNYVGNVVVFGPSTRDPSLFHSRKPHILLECSSGANVQLFHADNLLDRNRNGVFDGQNEGAPMFGSFQSRATAWDFPPVTTHAASALPAILRDSVGARPWSRDAVDIRVINEAMSAGAQGRIIDSQADVGGWPTLATAAPLTDSDGDGMPDSWEIAHGSNPNRADNNGDVNGDGYTNLENYLHFAARLIR